jgi:hypothetical protein
MSLVKVCMGAHFSMKFQSLKFTNPLCRKEFVGIRTLHTDGKYNSYPAASEEGLYIKES